MIRALVAADRSAEPRAWLVVAWYSSARGGMVFIGTGARRARAAREPACYRGK
eukprot:COSAG01_NODE_56402_length_318_cov_2.004566_1_plen_52_part_10